MIDPGTGDEGGTTEGTFEVWWDTKYFVWEKQCRTS